MKSLAPGFSAISPSPHGNRAHQRALARAGIARQQQLFAKLQHHVGVVDHHGAVGQLDRHVLEPDRRAFGDLAALDRGEVGLVEVVERHDEIGDASRRGGEFGKPGIVIDDPIEGVLHLDEGRGRLHHLTERHGAREILRRA
jgi:hypothetical protein